MVKYILSLKLFFGFFAILIKKGYGKMSMNFLNLLILVTMGLTSSITPISVMVVKEYQIKAVFLYNFTKGFIIWPPSVFANDDEKPFHICVLGGEQLADILDTTIQGKTAKDGRSLVIDKLQNINAISSCQVIFIDKSQQSDLSRIRQLAIRYSILTVSDMADFVKTQGGMIELFTLENKLKVAINLCVLEQANIKATANLLQLSKVVRECPD